MADSDPASWPGRADGTPVDVSARSQAGRTIRWQGLKLVGVKAGTLDIVSGEPTDPPPSRRTVLSQGSWIRNSE